MKTKYGRPVLAKRVEPDELTLKSTEYHLGLSMLSFKETLENSHEVKLLRKLQKGLGSRDTQFKFRGIINKIAPYNRTAPVGSGLNGYMQKHKLSTPVDIIKIFKKDKTLQLKSYEHLSITLKEMNIGWNEALEYVCEAVNTNSQRYFYHRIEKEFLLNNGKALVDLVEYYYMMHKKDKANSINWLHQSKYLKDWSIQYNVEILGYDWFLKQFKKIQHHYDVLVKKFPKIDETI